MTKIDIISGFLGAGKTTLIKKLLNEVFKGEKIVLIENEFGEIGTLKNSPKFFMYTLALAASTTVTKLFRCKLAFSA